MRYPIAIELGGPDTAYGVVVPDLPGCFSAGDTLDDAIANASEAIAAWIDSAIDAGRDVPAPGPIDRHREDPDLTRWVGALADVDPAGLSTKAERVNITLPANVLRRIDGFATRHGETRSAFLARAALTVCMKPVCPQSGLP
jgi:predicted RNase H-like HicB family nuclease